MVLVLPFQTTAGTVRRVRVSLPLVADLVDGQKYFRPDELPAPAGEELRAMSRPQITKAPRAPTLRAMVKMAVKCDSAEQLGEQLKRRYDRQLQRRSLAPAGHDPDEAELDRILGDPV